MLIVNKEEEKISSESEIYKEIITSTVFNMFHTFN